MSKERYQNNWIIFIAIILIVVIVIAFTSLSGDTRQQQEAEVKKRYEEEQKLVKELEALQTKKEIFEKHELINTFTQEYLNEVCEKRYHQLIKVLIFLLVVSNVLIYFTVPKIDFISLFTWNGVALGLLNLSAMFFFLSVKKAKAYLKGIAMNYIEYRVYENRDKEYYNMKVEFYKKEIESIKEQIENKGEELSEIKNETYHTKLREKGTHQ
jgi:peptidoglycan hydrolase CwlO-like protein